MKKIIYSAMAVAMLATTSCQDDFAESFVGEEATVEFSISTPEIATRAYSDGLKATVLQYAIYDEAGNELTALTVDADDNKTLNNGCAKISLQLKNNKSYQMVVWAAAPNAPYTINFEDKTMTVNYDADKTICNDENRDAFYAYQEFTVDQNTTIDVKLKRPFAQLNIGAGDFTQSANSGYTPTESYVKVPAYSTLNFADGSVDGQDIREFKLHNIPTMSEDFPYDPDKTDAVKPYRYLAMNYILVGADQELVDIEFGHSNGNEGDTRTIGSVPVQRNYRTNIYGNILTSATDINVQIVTGYTGENNEEAPEYVNVATAQDLIDAVNGNEAPDNLVVTLTDNINLSDLFGPNLAPTRAGNIEPTYYVALANGKELTIDLNGCKLSAKENSQKSFALIQNKGTLTIKDSKGNGVITFIAENNRYWNNYSSVISNQPGGKLIIEGGIIEHRGGTDMAYAIDNLTNGKGTYAETIINGGTIKSTYRAIRQFLNGVEAQNILTVNGGTIESTGKNKSIWMQDASAKANSGTLNVYGDASINSAIYIEGNTSWDVEAYIEKAALKNGSTVITENVPEGYSVIEDSEVVKVINAETVETADELVAALKKNYNVYFLNDIKIDPASMSNAYGTTGINVKNGQTIDGNGYTLNIKGAGGTWDSGINTTGGLIKNITVTGSFRGIFINHTSTHSEKVVLENVTIGGNGTVYTISCDQGLYQGIEATNCTFNGWTSFAKTAGEAKFVNCSFGEGSGYKYCRPYSNTEFVNCKFCPGYEVDTTRATVTFTDCTFEE